MLGLASAGTAVASEPRETSDAAPDGCTEQRTGDTITLSDALGATSLDPLTNLGSASAGGIPITALYDTLVRFNPETGDYEPFIAESWEPNDDVTEWTVTLRDGVTFSNGDPLDAEAVKFSLDRMNTGTGSASNLSHLISGVEVVDDLTVLIKLVEPWGGLPYALSEETGMVLNPVVADGLSDDDIAFAPPVGLGAGPYLVDRFVPGEEIIMTARDDYWGGPLCIETLRFVPTDGGQAKWDAYQNGDIDMAFVTDARVIGDILDAGAPSFGVRGGLGRMLTLNVNDPEVGDLRIRQAIQYAIDYETLNQRVYDGRAEAASAIMPEENPIYGGPGLPYDPEKAAELVEAAKADGWDGTLSYVSSNDPDATETSLAVAAMLQAAGIEVETEFLVPNEATRRVLIERNYQIGLYGPATFEESVVNDVLQFRGGSPSNPSGVDDPAMNEAIEQVVRGASREEVKAGMEAWQTAWNDVIPAVNLFMVDWYFVYPEDLEGIVWGRDMVPMFHDAYIAD